MFISFDPTDIETFLILWTDWPCTPFRISRLDSPCPLLILKVDPSPPFKISTWDSTWDLRLILLLPRLKSQGYSHPALPLPEGVPGLLQPPRNPPCPPVAPNHFHFYHTFPLLSHFSAFITLFTSDTVTFVLLYYSLPSPPTYLRVSFFPHSALKLTSCPFSLQLPHVREFSLFYIQIGQKMAEAHGQLVSLIFNPAPWYYY